MTNFLSDSFDPQAYLQQVLRSKSFESERSRLSDAGKQIDKELHREVAQNHLVLVDQVSMAQDLDRRLESITASAQILQQSAQRLRHSIQEPYQQVQRKVVQLQNVWATTDLLRKLSKFLTLVAKLREQRAAQSKSRTGEAKSSAAASLDLPKEARTLRDVETVVLESNLKGIEIVDREAEWLKHAGESIRVRANDLLRHGMSNMNQAEIRTALQAYHNLDQLPKVVHSVISENAHDLRKTLARELDPQAIMQTINNSAGEESHEQCSRRIFLQRLDVAFQAMLNNVAKVSNLLKVLQKTRDPVSQAVFASLLSQPLHTIFSDELWKPMATLVQDRMPRIFKRFPVLSAEFPRMYRMFEDFVQGVMEHHPNGGMGGRGGEDAVDPLKWRTVCLQEVESLFLKESSERLKERVAQMLNKLQTMRPRDQGFGDAPVGDATISAKGSTPPQLLSALSSQIDVRGFIAAVNHEMTISRGESHVQKHILQNINNAMSQFVSTCKSAYSTAPSAVQVTSVATNNQLFNAVIYIALMKLHAELTQVAEGITIGNEASASENAKGRAQLVQTLADAEGLASSILTKLFNSVESHLEGILAKMHKVSYNISGRGPQGHSLYLKELEDRLLQVQRSILVVYSHANTVLYQQLAKQLAQRLITLFIRLASLVRPINEAGKVRLLEDVTQLQLCIGHLCSVEKLGKVYKELRALRTALMVETEKLRAALSSSDRMDGVAFELASIPPTVLLHVIYQRIPSDMQTIPDMMKKSLVGYCHSLDDDSAREQAEEAILKAIEDWGGRGAGSDPDSTHLLECAKAWGEKASRTQRGK